MRLALAVHSEIISELFTGSMMNPEQTNRILRLNRHQLLFNSSLVSEWEVFAKEKGQTLAYQQWLPSTLASKKTLKKVEDTKGSLEDILIGITNQFTGSIVVGDVDSAIISANKTTLFCSKKTFGEVKKDFISMEDIKEIDKSGGFLKNWFSLFETVVCLKVNQNQDAKLLAKYLSYFYDEKEMIVQDKYFVNNEGIFDKYIKPYIPTNCKLKIIIPVSNGSTHKKRLERKYGAEIKCLQDDTLHEGYIETSEFRINLGYRLKIFGQNEKTNRESIYIRRK